MLILQCIDMALPEANPLKSWCRQYEANQCVNYLKFWSPIHFQKFQALVTKKHTRPGAFSRPLRLIACFKDKDTFKSDAKRWFRKIASLEASDQEICLDQAFNTMKDRGLFLGEFYSFLYNLELAFFRKTACKD